MQARVSAVRSRSLVTPSTTLRFACGSSRGHSTSTASNRDGGGVTQRGRPVLLVAIRHRLRGSSTSPQSSACGFDLELTFVPYEVDERGEARLHKTLLRTPQERLQGMLKARGA